jgi:hypothetical protein
MARRRRVGLARWLIHAPAQRKEDDNLAENNYRKKLTAVWKRQIIPLLPQLFTRTGSEAEGAFFKNYFFCESAPSFEKSSVSTAMEKP